MFRQPVIQAREFTPLLQGGQAYMTGCDKTKTAMQEAQPFDISD